MNLRKYLDRNPTSLKQKLDEVWRPQKLSEEERPTDRLIQLLNKDCKQFKAFLKSPREPYLYRGSNNYFDGWIAVAPRKNRKPSDMPEHIHELLDTQFYNYFGWRARSEGVFVTGDMGHAEGYGRANIFLPADGFNYLWNPKISDLFTFLKKLDIFWRDVWNIEMQLEGYVEGYKKTDLMDAIEAGNEIIFRCKKYYLVENQYQDIVYDWAHSK